MKRFLVLMTASLLLFGSCANYRNIEIEGLDIKDIQMLSASKYQVEVVAVVDNPSGTNFVVKEGVGSILKDGKPFAYIVLKEEVMIPRRGVNEIGAKCEISLVNPLMALSMGFNYKSLKWESFTIDAHGVIKGGPVKKRIELNNVSAGKLYNYIKRKIK